MSIDVVSNDIAEQGRSVIDAALRGEITVDVGKDLLAALFAQSKIVELAELEERLRQLEGHHIAPPWELAEPKMRLITDQEKLPMRGKKRKLK